MNPIIRLSWRTSNKRDGEGVNLLCKVILRIESAEEGKGTSSTAFAMTMSRTKKLSDSYIPALGEFLVKKSGAVKDACHYVAYAPKTVT